VTPVTLIGLANLGRPRRPAGATTAAAEPVLPDPATATRQLAPLAAGLVTEADLPSLRQVQQLAVQAATALLSGQAPACAGLNTLASSSTARTELAVTGGRLHARLVWQDAPAAAALARRLIEELAAADPGRLRAAPAPPAACCSTTTPGHGPAAGTPRTPAAGGNASSIGAPGLDSLRGSGTLRQQPKTPQQAAKRVDSGRPSAGLVSPPNA
jgi:hypothetical protein